MNTKVKKIISVINYVQNLLKYFNKKIDFNQVFMNNLLLVLVFSN